MRARTAALLALFACSDEGTKFVPFPASDGARSLILLSQHGDAPVQALAIDLETSTPLMTDSTARVLALNYREKLTDLGLSAGVLPRATTEISRALPAPNDAHQLNVDGRSVEWVTIDPETSALFRNFRLHDISAEECVAKNGCYDDKPWCTVPCPEPEAPIAPAPPAPAAPPIAPRWTPCPIDWTEVGGACEPLPQEKLADCGTGEAVFPGENACGPIGGPCPAGRWPAALPPNAIYADASAANNGTGTLASPFRTLAAAIAAANDGDTIALAKGSYTEALQIDRAITVIGACAAETHLRAPQAASILFDASAAITIRNLHFEGGLHAVRSNAPLGLENVWIEGAETAIQLRAGAAASIAGVLIEAGDRGLDLDQNATASVARAAFKDVAGAAVFAGATANITLSRTSVFRGGGVLARSGGSIELERASFESLAGPAIDAADSGSTITARHAVIRGSAERAIQVDLAGNFRGERIRIIDHERPLFVEQSATATISDLIVVSPNNRAVHLGDASLSLIRTQLDSGVFARSGARLQLEDTTVYGAPLVDRDAALIRAEDRTVLDFTRVALQDAPSHALHASSEAVLHARDLTIRGAAGHGLWLEIGSGCNDCPDPPVDLERVSMQHVASRGLLTTPGTSARLRDLTIQNAGLGLDLSPLGDPARRAAVEVQRILLEDVETGFSAAAAELDLRDIEVRRAARYCVSFNEVGGSVDRVRVLDCHGFGVEVNGQSSDLSIDNFEATTLAGTEGCTQFDCLGIGFLTEDAAQTSIARFLIRGAAGYGAAIRTLSELRLEDGAIEDSGVGLLLTGAGEQERRALLTRVRFRNTARPIANTE